MPILSTLLEALLAGGGPVRSAAAIIDDSSWVGVHLLTDGDLDGDWRVYASCRSIAQDGTGVDVTDRFTPAVERVDHRIPSTQKQLVCASSLAAGWIWAVFTPRAGRGSLRADARIGR